MKYLCTVFSTSLGQAVRRYRLVLIFVAVVVCFNRTLDFFTVSGLENRHFQSLSVTGDHTLKNKVWQMVGAGEVCRSNTDLQYFAFLNRDVSHWLLPVNEFVARVSCRLYHLSGSKDVQVILRRDSVKDVTYHTVIGTPSGMRLEIMHECTGLKQIVLLLLTALFVRGGVGRKAAFFLLSSVLFLVANQVRILALMKIGVSWPEHFRFVHDYVFSYGIYAVLLLCVVLWNELAERKMEKEKRTTL